jgi:hypothetical protein
MVRAVASRTAAAVGVTNGNRLPRVSLEGVAPLTFPCRLTREVARLWFRSPRSGSAVLTSDATRDTSMSDEAKTTSWWYTLPGIITTVTATLTALTGLIVAINQTGWFGPRTPPAVTTSSALTPPPFCARLPVIHDV